MQDKCLRRSHIEYPKRFILTIYLVVAVIVSSVVGGIQFVGEPTEEIVNELPFATDIPGLGSAKADASQWEERSRQGFMGWVRLVPVPDEPETEGKAPSYEREVQRGFTIPNSYSPIFSERDLIRKLAWSCCEIIFYTITDGV